MTVAATSSIAGLDHTEQNTFDKLIRQYMATLPRNRVRQMYFDSKNALKDLGIAIPPDMKNIEMVLGWPAKAVVGLARRNKMDGFVIPGNSSAELGIDEIWDANNMALEASQAFTSAYTHSCAFLVTTKGDVQSGEPEVLINARSALWATGLWDRRRRRLSAFLSIVDTDDAGTPNLMVMYLPDVIITMQRFTMGWRVTKQRHALGRVPVEVLAYNPHLERPFGTSRISRPVMALADAALRTAVRMEVGAEFYSAPQRWIMGADESMFQDENGQLKSQWQAIIGRLWAAGRNEDGDLPTVGTFAATPQTPNIEQLRAYATQFSGETSIPVGSLGVVQDNPSSAEAIHAAKEDLLIEAEHCNEVFGGSLVRSVLTGIQIRDNLTEIPKELRRLRAHWRNPARMSQSANADAAMKTIQTFPWLAETAVGLELAGFDETTVERAMAELRQQQARSGITDRLRQAALGAAADPQVAELASRRGSEDVTDALDGDRATGSTQ